jgi:hypothetical protein
LEERAQVRRLGMVVISWIILGLWSIIVLVIGAIIVLWVYEKLVTKS